MAPPKKRPACKYSRLLQLPLGKYTRNGSITVVLAYEATGSPHTPTYVVNALGGAGPLPAPVPLNVTACGEPTALFGNARLVVRLPAALGVNTTVTAQLAPAAKLAGQVFPRTLKSSKLPPLVAIELITAAAAPLFVIVMV